MAAFTGLGLLATTSCPDGWTPSPNASGSNQCFIVPSGRSSSLRSCVENCGAHGGMPACITSAEENAFVAELIGTDWAWLGLYQNDTDGEQGWGRCVGNAAPAFTSICTGCIAIAVFVGLTTRFTEA